MSREAIFFRKTSSRLWTKLLDVQFNVRLKKSQLCQKLKI